MFEGGVAVGGLRSAVDELAGEDLAGVTDAALAADLVELRRVVDRLEAQWLRRLAAFDRRGGWRPGGALSVAGWLREACRLGPGAARERAAVARRLAELPATTAAFVDGDIGYPHVRLIATATGATPARRAAVAAAEPTLVEAARRLDPPRLAHAVAHWAHAVDPDGVVAEANAAHAARRLHVSSTFAGTVVVDGQFDPEGGATLLCALGALHRPAAGDTRTPAQRRADALVELARRALDAGGLPEVAGERPHLTVTVDLATLERRAGAPAAELDWTGPVSGATARRLACDAAVARVVTAGGSQPLDVGRATRTVPPAIRRALTVRDRGCAFPGCDRPPPWTDAHHLRHWAEGGPTSVPNLTLLCRPHHRAVHEHGWQLARRPDGSRTAAPPGGAAAPTAVTSRPRPP